MSPTKKKGHGTAPPAQRMPHQTRATRPMPSVDCIAQRSNMRKYRPGNVFVVKTLTSSSAPGSSRGSAACHWELC